MSTSQPTATSNRRGLVIIVLLAIILLLAFLYFQNSKGIDSDNHPLLGIWQGTAIELAGSNRPFTLHLVELETDKTNPDQTLIAGCISYGAAADELPVSGKAIQIGDGMYELTFLGNVSISEQFLVMRFSGRVEALGRKVSDDHGQGTWESHEGYGAWNADHINQDPAECQPFTERSGSFLSVDVNQVQQYEGDEIIFQHLDLFVDTNIVSSAALVTAPDGATRILREFTDIFSPNVDFISNFRFGEEIKPEGIVIPGEYYIFTLLDGTGNPIPGTERRDIWTECSNGPPRNVTLELSGDINPDLVASWDEVPPAAGWDPANGVGEYGISVIHIPEIEGAFFGANTTMTRHVIPWSDFEDASNGEPAGINFGFALEEFPDGNYAVGLDVYTNPTHPDGVGSECHIFEVNQPPDFQKLGEKITIIVP